MRWAAERRTGDQIVTITPEDATITDVFGAPAEGTEFHVGRDAAAAGKGGFDSFLEKEIHDQPDAVERWCRIPYTGLCPIPTAPARALPGPLLQLRCLPPHSRFTVVVERPAAPKDHPVDTWGQPREGTIEQGNLSRNERNVL